MGQGGGQGGEMGGGTKEQCGSNKEFHLFLVEGGGEAWGGVGQGGGQGGEMGGGAPESSVGTRSSTLKT